MSTIRRQMIALLADREYDAQELSGELHIPEKEVHNHLSHISKTVSARKQRLYIRASVCFSCGYEFKERKRFTKPGRCPKCRHTHIQAPGYWIA